MKKLVGGATATTLEQLLNLPAEERGPYQWILEKSQLVVSFVNNDSNRKRSTATPTWDDIRRWFFRSVIQTVPVCAETSTDAALYLDVLGFWQVDWEDTPDGFLALIVGVPDRDGRIAAALRAEAETLPPRNRMHIDHLISMREASTENWDTDDIAVLSNYLHHILFAFATSSMAASWCEGETKRLEMFMQPWMRMLADIAGGAGALDRAAVEMVSAFVRKWEQSNIVECTALVKWLARAVLRSTIDAPEQMKVVLGILMRRVAQPLPSHVSTSRMASASMQAVLEVLLLEPHPPAVRGTIRSVMRSNTGITTIIVSLSPLYNPLHVNAHRFTAPLIRAMVEAAPSLLFHGEFATSIFSFFKDAENGLDGAIALADRMVEAYDNIVIIINRTDLNWTFIKQRAASTGLADAPESAKAAFNAAMNRLAAAMNRVGLR